MDQLRWTIDGRHFTSLEEYEAALRDKQLIDKIVGNLSLGNEKDIEKIYQTLQLGKFKFETIVGRQFDDNMFELYNQIKREQEQREEQKERLKQKLHLDFLVKEGKKQEVETKNIKPASIEKSSSQIQIKKEKNDNIVRFENYDQNLQKEIVLQLKKRARKRRLIALGCVLVCLTCFGYIAIYNKAAEISEQQYMELAALKEKSRTTVSDTPKEVKVHRTEDNIVIPDILPEYQMLYEKNPEIIGWIKIDDTVIDYPVMQTDNNEFYLNHDFNKETDKNGCIFMDNGCNVLKNNDNTILYGHHMRSGAMFGSLNKYKDISYLQEHPTITFDTIYEHQTYQIVYVFQSKVYSEEDVTFKYYQFINAASEKEFNSYMNEMSKLSLYDTGASASYGDKLLTLSTCDYQESKGRLVVVAKKV